MCSSIYVLFSYVALKRKNRSGTNIIAAAGLNDVSTLQLQLEEMKDKVSIWFTLVQSIDYSIDTLPVLYSFYYVCVALYYCRLSARCAWTARRTACFCAAMVPANYVRTR